jgi:hypothetical protein
MIASSERNEDVADEHAGYAAVSCLGCFTRHPCGEKEVVPHGLLWLVSKAPLV